MQADDLHGRRAGHAGSPQPEWITDNEVIDFLGWSARFLGLLVAGLFLFMFFGESC